jgi:hypothetical protein
VVASIGLAVVGARSESNGPICLESLPYPDIGSPSPRLTAAIAESVGLAKRILDHIVR